MACVYCDSYKLEKKHECAGRNISHISRKCSLERSPDTGLKHTGDLFSLTGNLRNAESFNLNKLTELLLHV